MTLIISNEDGTVIKEVEESDNLPQSLEDAIHMDSNKARAKAEKETDPRKKKMLLLYAKVWDRDIAPLK